MPEISRMPSELATGQFQDRLMATRLDTLERNSALYGDFNIPDIIYVPKDLSTDRILQSQKLPSLTEYLDSPDPKLRNLGKEYLAQDAQNNISLTKGVGLPDMVRYQPGQEKFTTDHWWSESGKTKFGFNPDISMAENEDLYHREVWDNYSMLGKTWRGVGTGSLRVLSKLVTGLVGMVGDIGSMAWNGIEELAEAGGGPKNNFWADVSDNVLSRAMHNVDDYVKNEIVPTYKSINYDDKGAFSKLTDPYFWQNEMAEGAGFLLQFAIPATALGKLTVAAKAARLSGQASTFQKILAAGVGESATAGRFAKATGKALETLTGSRNVGGIAAHAFNTTMESVAETKDGFDTSVKNLMRKGYSEEEAKRIASEQAPKQFGLNMMILTASNALENKWFQKLAGNRVLRREAVNAGADIVERKIGRIGFYGPQALRGIVMEGFWEENAQAAAGRVAAGEYMRRGDDTPSEGTLTKAKPFFKQLLSQTMDASWWGKGDKEVADSIMAGAVLGAIGGAAFSKLAGEKSKGKILPLGERRTTEKNNADLVASIKNAKAAWMNISVMPEDLYNDDGSFNEEKVKEKAVEINAKLEKIQSMFTRKATIDDIKDPVRREQLQHILFADFIRGHILKGTGTELIEKLKDWSSKSPEELALYGVSPEVAEDPQRWAVTAQRMFDEYHKIEELKFHNPDKLPVDSYMKQVAAVRAHIFDYTAQKFAAETAARKYADLEAEYNPFTKTPSAFNSYNELIAKAELYRQTLEEPNLDAQTKAFAKEEYDKLKLHIDTLKQGLTDHETSNTSDFIFDKGTDVKAREAEIMKTLNNYLEFQWNKENEEKAVEQFDSIIKEYSDPDTGLPKWNQEVKKWNDIISKVKLKKLTDLGYTEAEVMNMTPEKQEQILIEEAKKPEPQETQEEPVAQEPVITTPTLESIRAELLTALQNIDPKTTEDNLDTAVANFMVWVNNNPNSGLPQELLDLLDAYAQAKVTEVKEEASGQFVETSEMDNTPDIDPIIPEEVVEEEIIEEVVVIIPPPPTPPIPPVEEPGMVPPNLLDEVRRAYRLHEQAFENDTTFKDEAEKENLVIHNNRIDNSADKGKNDGTINVVTSNPKDIEKGAVSAANNNLARFNFLDQLSTGKLKKEDYKLVLSIGKQGGIYGVVADTEGNFVKFDESGKPFKEGSNLLFYLDGFDLYSPENLSKRRSDVVLPPFAVAPMTATPITLHPSFTGVDVLSVLTERIKTSTVTASINFVTQGMLYREGVNNTYNIPKNAPTTTATQLFEKGHLKDEKGDIPSESYTVDGVYYRGMRIHFQLLKDISNPDGATEVAEFHPVKLSEATNEKGEKVIDTLKAANGDNIFEAAVKGNLEATADNALMLSTLLRPDKFYVLNLGTVLLVVDLKKFKKFLTSGKVSHEELMKLTNLKDIYNSELNINRGYYTSRNELPLQGLLEEGNDNYSRFINKNVVSSAKTIKIGQTEGYTRVNKRMTIIVDENMEEMKKVQNQETQMEESPANTVVKLPETLSDEEIVQAFNNPDPNIDLGDVTKDDC